MQDSIGELILLVLENVTVETLNDWSKCFSNISVSIGIDAI